MNWKTIKLHHQRKIAWLRSPVYQPIVHKSIFTRSKKPAKLRENVLNWIMKHVRPSSNTKHIIKYKRNGVVQRTVVHWRESSIRNLFYRCKAEVPLGHLLHKTYFYETIPPYVKLAKLKDGLCPIHLNAHYLMKELLKCRKKWHQNCTCTCEFCSIDGCNHGSNPDISNNPNANCAFRTCPRCKPIKCRLEWHDVKTVWYTTSLQDRAGGGQHWIDEPHNTSRITLMRYWRQQMREFETHNSKNELIKDVLFHLKHNLPLGHVLIKGDFIQNFVHQRNAESAESHYNRRQTQLLVFVVWYHSPLSTKQKPVIKKITVAYLSGFLRHSSLFFQKCFIHLNIWIRELISYHIEKVFYFT